MSLYRSLNEDMLEESKNRVSYKTYMRNGAALGAGLQGIRGGIDGAINPYNPDDAGTGAAAGAIGGAIQGAILGAGTAFARNHSQRLDNFAKGKGFTKNKSIFQKFKRNKKKSMLQRIKNHF